MRSPCRSTPGQCGRSATRVIRTGEQAWRGEPARRSRRCPAAGMRLPCRPTPTTCGRWATPAIRTGTRGWRLAPARPSRRCPAAGMRWHCRLTPGRCGRWATPAIRTGTRGWRLAPARPSRRCPAAGMRWHCRPTPTTCGRWATPAIRTGTRGWRLAPARPSRRCPAAGMRWHCRLTPGRCGRWATPAIRTGTPGWRLAPAPPSPPDPGETGRSRASAGHWRLRGARHPDRSAIRRDLPLSTAVELRGRARACHADPVISRVGDEQGGLACHDDAQRSGEAGAGGGSSVTGVAGSAVTGHGVDVPGGHVSAEEGAGRGGDHLDHVVAGVSDDHVPGIVGGYAFRSAKQAGQGVNIAEGTDPALEKHYVPRRSQRARSVLTFFAQDSGTHNLVYANADISKATQAREAIAFCDHWKAVSGAVGASRIGTCGLRFGRLIAYASE